MPEEATLEAPTDTATESGNAFARALAAAQTNEEPAPEKAKPDPAKPAAKGKVEQGKEGIPEHLLTGDAPPDAKPADDALADIEPPEKLSPKAKAGWEELRLARKTAISERDAARKELEDARLAGASSAEMDALRAEIKTAKEHAAGLESEVERSNFERSPKFRALTAQEAEILADAKSYTEEGADPNAIEFAARAKGAARLKILREAGMDAETIAGVTSALQAYDGVQKTKEHALANSKAVAAEWETKEHGRAEAQRARDRAEEDQIFTRVGVEVERKFAPFQKVEGQDSWNAQTEALKAEAKAFYNGNLSMDRVAEIAYAGVAYRVVHEMNTTLRERLKAVTAERDGLKSAQPGVGSAAGEVKAGQPVLSGDDASRRAFDMARAQA